MWPYLLGLYPLASTKEERATIDQQGSDAYHRALAEWKEVERIQKIIAERERVRRATKGIVVPPPRMAQGGHQVDRVATSVPPSRPVSLPKADPSSSPAHSRSSSPSLYSISPSTPDKKLRVPSSTDPSLNEDVKLNHSQVQTDLTDRLQEDNTQPVPCDSGIANGSNGLQKVPDDLQANSINIDSDSVDGTVASSLSKVQNGLTDGPSEDSESVNGAELTVILEAVAREEEVLSGPPTVPESHLAASGDGKDGRVDGEGQEGEEGGEGKEEGEKGEGGERGSDPIDNGGGEECLDSKGQDFAEELFKIDKDIPRCDRNYW